MSGIDQSLVLPSVIHEEEGTHVSCCNDDEHIMW